MIDQLPLWRHAQETQREAAFRVAPAAAAMREKVFAFVAAQPNGATNEEIASALAMKIQTVCPRVFELRRSNRLVDSGQKRPTASGSPAKVWRTA